MDFDGKLRKDGKVLYRLNLMGQMKGTQRNYEFNNRVSIAPVIQFQINPTTSLTAEYTLQVVGMSPIGSAYAFSPKGISDLPHDFTMLEPNMRTTNIKDQSLFLSLIHIQMCIRDRPTSQRYFFISSTVLIILIFEKNGKSFKLVKFHMNQ